jgi:AAA15 family ATPase/GTPase
MEFIPRKDGIRYRYLIEITKFHVEREELFFYPKSQPALLFSRNKGEAIRYGGYLQGKKKNIESELLENNLFLSKAANSNNKQLQEIYLYFLSTLSVMVKGTVDELISKNRTSRAMLSEKNKALRNKVETLLISVDTGITALNVSRREMDDEIENLLASDMPKVLKDAMTDNFVYRTRTIHKLYEDDRETGTVTFDLSEESEGTIKLYGISATIIETLLEGSILVIDEIDNSLHPHITALILKLFNDPKTNRNNAQLIAITHDASLLDPKLIRRDQVWFTKKAQNSTELYSLVEFDKNEVRAKTQFGEWYLDGRFNAVPVINKSIYDIFSEIE